VELFHLRPSATYGFQIIDSTELDHSSALRRCWLRTGLPRFKQWKTRLSSVTSKSTGCNNKRHGTSCNNIRQTLITAWQRCIIIVYIQRPFIIDNSVPIYEWNIFCTYQRLNNRNSSQLSSHFVSTSTISASNSSPFVLRTVHSCPCSYISNALWTKPSKTPVSAELNILLIQHFLILHLVTHHFLLIQVAAMFAYVSITDAVYRLLPRRPLLHKCHTVSRYTSKCDFIYAHKQNTAFLARIITKFTVTNKLLWASAAPNLIQIWWKVRKVGAEFHFGSLST
jgi:hypothetical protein